jgi:transaldolase
MSPIKKLTTLGQAVWLDAISRELIDSGRLQSLIQEDGISGLTSNPAIFEKAITGSQDYSEAIAAIAGEPNRSNEAVYEHLAISDIREAANLLQPLYQSSNQCDGYVSLEVSPRLANDTQATVTAAKRLWQQVDRPNLMIKIPATPEGLPAIETLIAEGLNINVTLLFSVPIYEQVADRYLRGLEQRQQNGKPLSQCASVASFFLSRIDSRVDQEIESRLGTLKESESGSLKFLRGEAAIASARLAYQAWKRIFSGQRWAKLEAQGARAQRLLWASTSTKNPAYDDVRYLEQLIGVESVTTVPLTTLDAYRDHGRPQLTLENDLNTATANLDRLALFDIDLVRITDELLRDGLSKFDDAYTRLLDAVAAARIEGQNNQQDATALRP